MQTTNKHRFQDLHLTHFATTSRLNSSRSHPEALEHLEPTKIYMRFKTSTIQIFFQLFHIIHVTQTLKGTLEIRLVGFFGERNNFSDLLLIGDSEYGDQGSLITTDRSDESYCKMTNNSYIVLPRKKVLSRFNFIDLTVSYPYMK